MDNINIEDFDCWAFDNDGELWQAFWKVDCKEPYGEWCRFIWRSYLESEEETK